MKKIKRLKFYGFAGLAVFFLTCGLVMWLSLSAMRLISFDSQMEAIPAVALQKINTLKKETSQISALQVVDCWTKIESLMAVQPWLEQSATVHLEALKHACFGLQIKKESSPTTSQMDQSINAK